MKSLIGTEEAASILGVSVHEVRTLVKRKVLPGQRVAGRLVFDSNDIHRVLEEWDADDEDIEDDEFEEDDDDEEDLEDDEDE